MIFAPGDTSKSIDVEVSDDSGQPVTGLVAATFPPVYYKLSGNTTAVLITLSDLALITTAWASGGLKEDIGSAGVYRLDLPDAALASAGELTVYGKSSGKNLLRSVHTVKYVPANAEQWKGTALASPDTAGYPKVTLKSGTGTGEVSLSSGKAAATMGSTDYSGNTVQTGDSFALANNGTYGLSALQVAISALQTLVNNISNNTSTRLVAAPIMEIPDSSTVTYELDLLIMDENGNMEAPDSTPTVTAKNAAGTDRSSGLSALTLVSTGHYTLTYTLASTDSAEQLVFTAVITEGAVARKAVATTTVANADITGMATKVNAIYTDYARRTGDYATPTNVTDAKDAIILNQAPITEDASAARDAAQRAADQTVDVPNLIETGDRFKAIAMSNIPAAQVDPDALFNTPVGNATTPTYPTNTAGGNLALLSIVTPDVPVIVWPAPSSSSMCVCRFYALAGSVPRENVVFKFQLISLDGVAVGEAQQEVRTATSDTDGKVEIELNRNSKWDMWNNAKSDKPARITIDNAEYMYLPAFIG